MVSRFPRLSTAFRALAEKFKDDSVSDRFEAFGHRWTIINVFEFPPALIEHFKQKEPGLTHSSSLQTVM